MGLDRALDISFSGIQAERVAMELIASNLANVNTTRSIYGGPYRRRIAALSENPLTFDQALTLAEHNMGGGVRVDDIIEDATPFAKVYNPGHPDADAQGYVLLPNVNLANEMVDQIYVSRLYEANITTFNAIKKMQQDTIQAF